MNNSGYNNQAPSKILSSFDFENDSVIFLNVMSPSYKLKACITDLDRRQSTNYIDK